MASLNRVLQQFDDGWVMTTTTTKQWLGRRGGLRLRIATTMAAAASTIAASAAARSANGGISAIKRGTWHACTAGSDSQMGKSFHPVPVEKGLRTVMVLRANVALLAAAGIRDDLFQNIANMGEITREIITTQYELSPGRQCSPLRRLGRKPGPQNDQGRATQLGIN